MKNFYYLNTCDTCKRIMKELDLGKDVKLREIKSQALSPEEVDRLGKKAGSFEAIFSKRSRKYREFGLHERNLTEKDYRHYLLEDYTFLRRPVLETDDQVIAGNSKAAVAEMKSNSWTLIITFDGNSKHMLFSMTGFGKAQGSFAGKKITVEIKSLNSKQFDLSSKIPQLYREKEMEIREMISDRLGRGKIDLSIYAESDEGDKKVSLNQSLASAYLNEIKRFAESGNIPIQGDILRTVLGMPDVLQAEKSDLSEEEWAYVSSLLKESIDKLMEFRGQEGEKLGKDIEARIHKIEELREAVIPHLDERIKVVRERLEKNVKDLIENDQGDKNRFEQEIVYYLEKLDITEEQVRLKGHCHYFLETMQVKDHPVGKKLGFISQEIGREINTMGSKANHVTIQRLVVQMKDELEKIKEQLLNIN